MKVLVFIYGVVDVVSRVLWAALLTPVAIVGGGIAGAMDTFEALWAKSLDQANESWKHNRERREACRSKRKS